MKVTRAILAQLWTSDLLSAQSVGFTRCLHLCLLSICGSLLELNYWGWSNWDNLKLLSLVKANLWTWVRSSLWIIIIINCLRHTLPHTRRHASPSQQCSCELGGEWGMASLIWRAKVYVKWEEGAELEMLMVEVLVLGVVGRGGA